MDVSDWTIDQRMRLPDWCFGQRFMYSCYLSMYGANTFQWEISTEALPDPACIWSMGLICFNNDFIYNHVRIGLRDTVPTSEAEMNTSQNIFPDLGNNTWAPPRICLPIQFGTIFEIILRMGIDTGGKKFVAEGFVHADAVRLNVIIYLTVSDLPTSMAGWLAHSKV